MSPVKLTAILPITDELIKAICNMTRDNAHMPMLSRTHGQPASPTTLGKEMAIFAMSLSRERKELSKVEILGKFAGAVGNYNAHFVAYPEVYWPRIAEEFVKSLGLSFNPYVDQIESHDYMAKLFHSLIQFNNVLTDFDRDIWGYISLGYFKQITKAGEIESSTMPHKVNPIDFENSEGNLGVASHQHGKGLTESINKKVSQEMFDSIDREVVEEIGVPASSLSIPALIAVSRRQLNVRPTAFFFIKCSLDSKEVEQFYSSAQDGYESTQLYAVTMIGLENMAFKMPILN